MTASEGNYGISEQLAAEQRKENVFNLKRKKILVVDDDPIVQKMIHRILKVNNFEVLKAADGRAALKMVDRDNVDLVLMDIMMPGLDGITACKYLKANVNLEKPVPVIMLTAKSEPEFVVRSREAGAEDYIVKPFTPELLLEKVQKHLA